MESNQFSKKSLTSMDLFCVLGRGAIALGSLESRKVRKFCFCPIGQTTAIGEVLEKAE